MSLDQPSKRPRFATCQLATSDEQGQGVRELFSPLTPLLQWANSLWRLPSGNLQSGTAGSQGQRCLPSFNLTYYCKIRPILTFTVKHL